MHEEAHIAVITDLLFKYFDVCFSIIDYLCNPIFCVKITQTFQLEGLGG